MTRISIDLHTDPSNSDSLISENAVCDVISACRSALGGLYSRATTVSVVRVEFVEKGGTLKAHTTFYVRDPLGNEKSTTVPLSVERGKLEMSKMILSYLPKFIHNHLQEARARVPDVLEALYELDA